MPFLDVTLTVSTEERSDRWAAFVHELGFFAYGETEEEATDRVGHIVSALAESFAGDLPGFNAYLDKHEVKHVLLDDIDTSLKPVGSPTDYRGHISATTAQIQATVPRLRTFGKVEVPNGAAA